MKFALIFLLAASVMAQASHAEMATTQPATATSAATTRASSRPVHTSSIAQEPAPSAPFQPSDAATQAEAVSIQVRAIQGDLNDDHVTAPIQNDLPILTSQIDASKDETARLLAAAPSLQVLATQEQDWASIADNLNEWKRMLERRLDQIRPYEQTMRDISNDWYREGDLLWFLKTHNRALDIVRIAQGPVDNTLHMIDATVASLQRTVDQVAGLRQSVDFQAAKVQEILNSVHTARGEAFNQLFMQNVPPLWSTHIASRHDLGLMQEGQDSFDRQYQAVRAYIHRRRDNVAIQMVVLVLLTGGLYWVRRQVRHWSEEDPVLRRAALVFSSPIATALVLSFSRQHLDLPTGASAVLGDGRGSCADSNGGYSPRVNRSAALPHPVGIGRFLLHGSAAIDLGSGADHGAPAVDGRNALRISAAGFVYSLYARASSRGRASLELGSVCAMAMAGHVLMQLDRRIFWLCQHG